MLQFPSYSNCFFFFFNDTATTEIYTLSLHDALPICGDAHVYRARAGRRGGRDLRGAVDREARGGRGAEGHGRSEEHTSELQSHSDLVCRLLLEKKKMGGETSKILTSTALRKTIIKQI